MWPRPCLVFHWFHRRKFDVYTCTTCIHCVCICLIIDSVALRRILWFLFSVAQLSCLSLVARMDGTHSFHLGFLMAQKKNSRRLFKWFAYKLTNYSANFGIFTTCFSSSIVVRYYTEFLGGWKMENVASTFLDLSMKPKKFRQWKKILNFVPFIHFSTLSLLPISSFTQLAVVLIKNHFNF